MPLTPGTRLGPYEISTPLGAGGMGEVFRATDTRLGREVAVKVLPQHLSDNPEVRARFEREAKTVSSLNHPNICTLHDVGREGDTDFLVMELVEGETLAQRLEKGALPAADVLKLGVLIADALDRAHRAGVIHRDLKPGNVMLTKSGAKLMDFGLARATGMAGPAGGSGVTVAALTQSPTVAAPLTAEGTIVGTFQYMAPEQLEGKEADARADLWALGCVLYEMATGKRAFEGKSQASLITSIMGSQPPPISQLAPLAPPGLERLVQACLAKDPAERLQSAHDIRMQLAWLAEGGSQAGLPAPVAARRMRQIRLAVLLAAAGWLVAVAMLVVAVMQREPQPVFNTSVIPPKDMHFVADVGAPAISPDGLRLAYVAAGQDGKLALWIRTLSTGSAQALPGTEGATHPFWSPDSRQVGFFASGKLKRIDAAGGPAQLICDASQGRGGAWGADGTILFTPSTVAPLHRVPVTGGPPIAETVLDSTRNEASHRYAEFLPDGKHYLYLVEATIETPGTDQGFALFAGAAGSKEKKLVVATNGQARYSPATGNLLFLRGGTLVAQRFDPRTQALSGEAVPVAENVRRSGRFEAGFSLSRTGLLVFQAGSSTEPSQLALLDRSGREVGLVGKKVADYRAPRLSRDGMRVAVSINDPGTQRSDVWVIDVARGTSTRLTFDPEDDYTPVWSRDDRRIYFSGSRSGRGDVFAKSSSGTGTDAPVYASPNNDILFNVSPDGASAWMHANRPKQSWDILRLDLQSGEADDFVATPFAEWGPTPSPDGRWLAYASNESGRAEVYVQSLLDDGGKWQVSIEGGRYPVWTRGGREIVYQGDNRKLVAVDIRLEPTFQAGTPKELFDPRIRVGLGMEWDVTADGERFLVNRAIEVVGMEPLTLIQNWPAALKK